MASMQSRFSRFALMASPLLLIAPAMCVANELTPAQIAYYQSRLGLPGGGAARAADAHPIAEAVIEWQQLSRDAQPDFARISRFLIAHRGWPMELDMRRAAEASLNIPTYSPPEAIPFFEAHPPLTPTGHLRHAQALLFAGRRDDALAAARRAWASGPLSAADEAELLTRFGANLTSADHDARMERLLWSGEGLAATRQLALVSAERRSEFAARAAYRTRAPGAASLGASAEAANPSLLTSNAGYIADRATWLRATDQAQAARALLSRPRSLTAPPLDAEEWYETLLTNARAAASAGQYELAFNIARQVDDALPAGAAILEQSIGVRDDYTSLVWLAASTASERLGRPRDAMRLYELYAGGGRSPQVQARGLYWAARAAETAGDRTAATQFLNRAARHLDQFYGQLAIERLGLPQPVPVSTRTATFSDADRAAFTSNSLVRAARTLGELGAWRDQTLFLRAISNNARSDASHHFAFQLARDIGRPDLSVMIGRSARINGLDDYVPAAFPTVGVPEGHESNWTFIHAISRQESQFDRMALSRVGARGMMQLMPGTAREQAGRLGLEYDLDRLVTDPQYNIMMGSDYFRRMLSYFRGSYPLAVAAYNAGPGNVNRWLRANGDPRNGDVDILRWIEQIPLSETRGYVQHVLENAVVYDTLNPTNRGVEQRNLLSRYLGRRPG